MLQSSELSLYLSHIRAYYFMEELPINGSTAVKCDLTCLHFTLFTLPTMNCSCLRAASANCSTRVQPAIRVLATLLPSSLGNCSILLAPRDRLIHAVNFLPHKLCSWPLRRCNFKSLLNVVKVSTSQKCPHKFSIRIEQSDSYSPLAVLWQQRS